MSEGSLLGRSSPPAPSPAHGGLVHDELEALGLSADDVLDVSVNVNPYGPAPSVRRALARAALHRYPDPTAMPARRALGRFLGVSPSRVAVGNGAVELLWACTRSFARAGDTVAVVEPAFSEVGRAARCAGARVVAYRTQPETGFALDLGALAAVLDAERPRVAYVCTPANPTGVFTDPAALAALAAAHPETRLVVDLSFLSLSAHHDDGVVHASDRVVWVRSLTKDHALAGLRVGFVVAPEDVVETLHAERPPWSVSALAEAAVVAATEEEGVGHVARCRDRLLADRRALEKGLGALGLTVHPSDTLFLLAHLGAGVSATALRQNLLARHRVLVRDATSFGLPHHLRLCARPEADRERLLEALRKELRP